MDRAKHPDLYAEPSDSLSRADAEALVERLVKDKLAEMAAAGELPAGPKGDPLTWDDLTAEQKASLKGEPGNDGEDGEPGNLVQVVFNDEDGADARTVLSSYMSSLLRSNGQTIASLASQASAAVQSANTAALSANAATTLATNAASTATNAASEANVMTGVLSGIEHGLLVDAYAQYLPAIIALRSRVATLESAYGRYLNQIRSASGNARLKVFDTNSSDSDSDSDSDVPGLWNGSVVLEYVSLGNTFKLTPATSNGTTYRKIMYGNNAGDYVMLDYSGVTFGGSVQVVNGYSCYGSTANGSWRLHNSSNGWKLIYRDNSYTDHELATVTGINTANPVVEWQPAIVMYEDDGNSSGLAIGSNNCAPTLTREYASYQRSLKLDAGVHLTSDNVSSFIPQYLFNSLVYRGSLSGTLPAGPRIGDLYGISVDTQYVDQDKTFKSGSFIFWDGTIWRELTAPQQSADATQIVVPASVGYQGGTEANLASVLGSILSDMSQLFSWAHNNGMPY